MLELVAATAARLCDTDVAAIFRRDGELWRLATSFGFPPEYEAEWRAVGAVPLDRKSQGVGWRAARERRPVHIHDLATVPGLRSGPIRQSNLRTALPLLREGEAVGTIVLGRQRFDPSTDRQIELVSTFADQAVIAIENTRLTDRATEALEQQTATAEVLQVINASPGNLAPVFDVILEKAKRLCEADMGTFWTFDGEYFYPIGVSQGSPLNPEVREKQMGWRPSPNVSLGRVMAGENVVHIVDVTADAGYQSDPIALARTSAAGTRSALTVALRSERGLLGAITTARQSVRPYSDKQIAPIAELRGPGDDRDGERAADTEQREALEQQTATAEVLQGSTPLQATWHQSSTRSWRRRTNSVAPSGARCKSGTVSSCLPWRLTGTPRSERLICVSLIAPYLYVAED